MKLFIFHTPELTPVKTTADCAIAVDVLRATSTIVTALAAGAEAVQVFSDLDKLLTVSEDWPSEKRIRAGERGGAKVEGFDFGNSPWTAPQTWLKDVACSSAPRMAHGRCNVLRQLLQSWPPR